MAERSQASSRFVGYVEAVALWSPRLPNWESAQAVIRGERTIDESVQSRPSPAVLAPTERRRAPDTVALALEVAAQACRSAKRSPHELDSVFASTHGDLAISDHLCSTLAATPELMSPTKFHNSVHNAAAGYWSIGTGTHTSYTAISAGEGTFAAGLLEAVMQVHCGGRPILYVAYDIEAHGPLATVVNSRGLFAVAMILNAVAESHRPSITLQVEQNGHAVAASAKSAAKSPLVSAVSGSALESAVPFLEALAGEGRQAIALRLNAYQLLRIEFDSSNTSLKPS